MILLKKDIQIAKKYMKMFNIISHQGNVNKKYSEMDIIKKKKKEKERKKENKYW
jgi:hypothetical protein